ncbi:MAG: archease [Actinomycetota bacterium]
MGGFEVVEHTADVGIRAHGASLEAAFEQTTLGLIEITGARGTSGEGKRVPLDVEAQDLAGLLVEWLGEIVYLQDARDAVIADVRVDRVEPKRASGSVTLMPRGDVILEGTAVKAITYHQVKVERSGERWTTQVYVDV